MQALMAQAEVLGQRLKDRKETVAVAESSSGGLISAALLGVPGAKLADVTEAHGHVVILPQCAGFLRKHGIKGKVSSDNARAAREVAEAGDVSKAALASATAERIVMPKFAANLSMMFNELPFPERFAAAAKASFKAVEFLLELIEGGFKCRSRINETWGTEALGDFGQRH